MTPHDPTENRDPQVAAWLAVEPLDELTRTRLVRNALDAAIATDAPAARPRRRWAVGIVAAAAALAVLVVISVGIVLAGRDDGSEPTAARTPSTAAKVRPEANEQFSEGAGDASRDATAAPTATADDSLRSRGLAPTAPRPYLGALGDVSTRARLRAALDPWPPPDVADASPSPPACVAETEARAGDVTATATGTVGGHPATVLVSERADGTVVATVVDHTTCAVGPKVTLRR